MSAFASRRALRFAFACATRTTGRACSRTGGSTAIRCCRRTPTSSRTRTISWPAPSLPSAAPEPGSTPSPDSSTTTCRRTRRHYVDPGREFIDSPFSNLSKYNRAGFEYQGTMDAPPLGANHRRLHLRRRERIHHLQLRPRHRFRFVQRHPRAALQQLSICAGTPDLEARVGAGGSRLRQQLQLRQQSRAARLGIIPAASAATRHSAERACAPDTPRASRSPASSSRSASREPIPRCPIPICSPSRTARGKRASSRDSGATGCR